MASFGYLMVDHRASPGLPEDIARKLGRPAGSTFYEADTMSCSHCKTVQIKNPLRVRARAHCSKCMHYICDTCEQVAYLPDYVHLPYEKVVDIIQATPLGSPMGLLLRPTKGTN